MLSRFVVSSQDLDLLNPDDEGYFSVLANSHHPLAAAIESKALFPTSKPLYCECGFEDLESVKKAGAFAKIRTGGIVPDAIPSPDDIANFVLRCAELRLAFKATAGLHHPIPGPHPLTYAADAPIAMLHGFINVFLAAAFAWAGMRDIHPLLEETDPCAFRFDESAHWRDWSLTVDQIIEARRNFAHSFGSCSFTEPVESLQKLGWL